ncbi:TetR/AcrR family transcriptional regulator [Dactylosporangium sp. CA-092794]|uniref:TetR/AcrR family transcriptional regulator n=1 Tax=Dactylosporangium sp. CA-092794 TaxID=3239929 RepID=UPI003D8BA36E
MPGGRPRTFDADAALDRALEVFWRHGYEGAALSELTEAMGVNRPSLYAVFGNKEQLFAKVLDRYTTGPAAYAREALDLPTAREVIERLVFGAIELTAGPGTPRGCLSVANVQPCGPEAESIRQAVAALRKTSVAALRQRLQRARAEGDLPAGTDPATLANLVAAITDGIATQAANGATRSELRRIAEMALPALPIS